MKKLTDWYPGDIKPVRIGIYQRAHQGAVFHAYWNGKYWGAYSFSVVLALECKDIKSFRQELPWRGLKEHHGTTKTN